MRKESVIVNGAELPYILFDRDCYTSSLCLLMNSPNSFIRRASPRASGLTGSGITTSCESLKFPASKFILTPLRLSVTDHQPGRFTICVSVNLSISLKFPQR